MLQTMSREDVKAFIVEMTDGNTMRLRKFNEHEFTPVQQYGPFALCNRKQVTSGEQKRQQMKMFSELVAYVAKVSTTIW